ncbi:MAG: SUMF1/EgtB/PvdO family nonheme iron enzyme [Kiritimatiellae bacterium]|nr:SUMF1/EgtB/PvdO family nonheme iron enzyme [Kiritimatiellia bacterium]MDD5520115.1 SUMF1/EgtB/PvdO family nonheme iron enzyme [Kiritimatiellia bacterium]
MNLQSNVVLHASNQKISKSPVYLSIFAFPGAGQFLQRRWIPAIFYSSAFFFFFFLILVRAGKLWIGTLKSIMDNKPFENMSFSKFVWPLGISIFIYLLSILDTIIAYRKECQLHAQRKLENALKNIPIVTILLLTSCVINSQAQCDDIFMAIRSNDVDRIDAIIEKSGFEVIKMGTTDGITPLHLAAALNRYSPAAFLISAGADVNARTSGGFTPLHWAASKDSMETAKLLIKSGADVNAKATSGITPLHWAANKNATNLLAMLIAAGADVEARTDNGFTPLHWATLKKSFEAARWLAFKIASDQVDDEVKNEVLIKPSQSIIQYVLSDESVSTNPVPQTSAKLDSDGKTLAVPIGMNETLFFVWIEPLKLWVSKYETTNAQFKRFKPDHNSMFRESFKLNNPDQPVVYVSWNDAKNFCDWLNKYFSSSIPVNCEFRLPTDKEWVLAARCGTNRLYPWGNEWPPKYGNFSDLTARKELSDWAGIKGYDDGFAVSCPVTESGVNEWNLYGLAGNVWEWCDDWFDNSKKYKVRHGGSWDFDDQKSLRIDYRGFDRSGTHDDTVGFRVVISTKRQKGS